MLQDMIHRQPQEQLPIEEIRSPLSAQLFEFCDSDFFQETFQNCEPAAPVSPNRHFPDSNLIFNTTNTTAHDGLENDLENDISAAIDFSTSPPRLPFHRHLPYSSMPGQPHMQFTESQQQQQVGMPIFEDVLPPYLGLNPQPSSSSSHFMEAPSYIPGGLAHGLSPEGSGIFSGNGLLLGSDVQEQQLRFQGDGQGLYCNDSMPIHPLLNHADLQGFNNESQQLVSGGSGGSATLASDITSLEDPSYNKVGKLSVEERKEKIHRYMKKRNERNFSKKIKYACRKTLADSRPRVRGRFAKNDEFGENPRTTSSNHEDEDDDDGFQVVVKEEDEMVDSTDIFAHISGVNSFNCSYPIQTLI